MPASRRCILARRPLNARDNSPWNFRLMDLGLTPGRAAVDADNATGDAYINEILGRSPGSIFETGR